MPVREDRLGREDGLGDAALELVGHGALIGLVGDLEVQVVEGVELGDDLSGQALLYRGQIVVGEGVDLVAPHRPDPVDVVRPVHGGDLPHLLLVQRAEEDHLHHDAAPGRLRYEVLQAVEVGVVPRVQVELVLAVESPRRVAALPRRRVAVRLRRQGVVGDPERARDLPVHPRERPGVVQPVRGEGFQVADVVEALVQHRPVVLPGGHQNRRLPPKQEVPVVVGMQSQGRVVPAGDPAGRSQESDSGDCETQDHEGTSSKRS